LSVRRRPTGREAVIDMLVAMIVAGVLVAFAVVWYLVTRGARATALSRSEFESVYDADAEDDAPDGGDRDAARRDFDAWQTQHERERLSWEDPTGE